MKPESISKNDRRSFHPTSASFNAESLEKTDADERRRRAIAVAGRFHSGVSDISAEHDDYLAEAFQG